MARSAIVSGADAALSESADAMLTGRLTTLSEHRAAAFSAADLLMDYLKSGAPFWKKEIRASGRETRSCQSSVGSQWLA